MKSTELEIISKACACRSFLYIAGFLTDVESEKIHGKIRKYQDKHRQNVSTDDLASVRIVMSDETDQLNQRIAELEAQVPRDVVPERGSCECGGYVLDVLGDRFAYCPDCGAKLDWSKA